MPLTIRQVRRMAKKSRKAARKAKTVRTLRPVQRKAVATIAQRVVNRARETKYVGQAIFEQPIPIYGDIVPTGTVTPQIFEALPDLQQGTAEYQRDGVKVEPKRLTCDMDLRFNNKTSVLNGGATLDQSAWDIDVHIWYGYVRRYKNYADIVANAANICNNLLDNGLGTTLRWGGGPYDHLNRVNNEWFSVKHKVIRMYRPLGVQNTASTAGGVTTYFPQEIHKTVRLGFKLPKALMYNENNATPENYAPVVIVGYQHRDATQAANSTTDTTTLLGKPALMMNIKNHLFFKDA